MSRANYSIFSHSFFSQLIRFKQSGKPHRAKLWEKVAENLEKNDHIKFKVSVHSVRDGYSRISQKSRKKARDVLKSTGTSPEITEYDTLMEELIEREDMSEEKRQNAVEDSSKVKLDRMKALDMRTKGMEKLSQTQKRQSDCEVGPKKKTQENKQRNYCLFERET